MPDKTLELAKQLIVLVSRKQGAIKMMDFIKSMGAVRSISIASSFLILFSSALQLTACDRSNAPASKKNSQTPDGTKPLTLERFDAQQGTFELGMAPCTPEGCAFEVRWLKANKLISSIALPVPAANQVAEKEATSLEWGADAGLYAWSTGMEVTYVSTVARPVFLDTDTMGLLITQRFGYEYINRLHRLAVPRDGKLEFLWAFTETRDYVWSAAVVSPPLGVTFYSGRYGYGLSESDFLSVTRLILNKDKGELAPAPQSVVAPALVVGDFMSPKAANKLRENDKKHCFKGYVTLSSDSVKAIPKGHNALVRVFVQRDQAEEEKKRLIQCGVSFKISIVDIQSSPMLYQDKE